MDWITALKIGIPAAGTIVGALIGALVGISRARIAYEAKLRELEKRAITAEATSSALGKKLDSLKSEIVEDVRDLVDASHFRLFSDLKTRLAEQSEGPAVRRIVEKGFQATVHHVEQLRLALGVARKPKTTTPQTPPRPAADAVNPPAKNVTTTVVDVPPLDESGGRSS